MTDDLKDRVMQFEMFMLPGQPRMMHIGTGNLVDDLWNEVQQLRKLLEDQRAELVDTLRIAIMRGKSLDYADVDWIARWEELSGEPW